MHDTLKELCDIVSYKLTDVVDELHSNGGKLTVNDADYVDKLTHTLKSIKAILAMPDDGYSYRRGAKRDAMGRYSRDSHEMVSRLHDMMESTDNPQIRNEIERLVAKVEAL